jgi:hypothetical protein
MGMNSGAGGQFTHLLQVAGGTLFCMQGEHVSLPQCVHTTVARKMAEHTWQREARSGRVIDELLELVMAMAYAACSLGQKLGPQICYMAAVKLVL